MQSKPTSSSEEVMEEIAEHISFFPTCPDDRPPSAPFIAGKQKPDPGERTVFFFRAKTKRIFFQMSVVRSQH